MKSLRIIILCVVTICGVYTSHAYDYSANNFYYNLNMASATATVTYKSTSYNSYSGNISIPETFIGPKDIMYTVTAIGDNAFKNCSSLSSISIPNTIISIGQSAFYGCTSISSISIPNMVESIGSYAFCGCTSLSKVTLPSFITKIDAYLFQNCSKLTSITIPSHVENIGEYAFDGCTQISSIDLTNSIKSIGNYAFRKCSSITNITFPETLSLIGNYAFQNCSSLSFVSFPKQLQKLGSYSFNSCTSLSTVTIPASVNEIGENAFSNSGIRSLVYDEGCTIALRAYATSAASVSLPSTLISIADNAFYDYSSLTAISFPKKLESIGESAFYNCAKLSSVKLSPEVINIGNNAFYKSGVTTLEYAQGCKTALRTYATGLTSVVIPASVRDFAPDAFKGCDKLENYYISDLEMWNYIFLKQKTNPFPCAHKMYLNGNLLTALNADFGCDIANYAFYECKELKIVNLTGSITGIQDYAFAKCPDLDAVAMSSKIAKIGIGAFQECTSLTSMRLGSGVKTVGAKAFNGCTNLNSLLFGGSEESFGESAFCDCSNLQKIILPNSITSIGSSVFKNCYELVTVNIPTELTAIPEYAFYDCHKLQSITIPDKVTSIGSNAFYNCNRLQTVNIPDMTTTIFDYAFSDCDSIRYLYLGQGVSSIGGYSFSKCKRLLCVYCSSSNVPSCNSNAFNESDPGYISLFVPEGQIDAYKSKSPWNSFGKIASISTAPVIVTGIMLAPKTTVLQLGDFMKMTAEVAPSNATNTKVNWTSSNTDIAYVNSVGSVLANGEGVATVTASAADGNGARAQSLIIVSDNFKPLSKVTVSKSSLTLAEGKEAYLTASTFPSNATYSGVSWSSSNPEVAVVNSIGVVTALTVGSTTITCTADDGNGANAKCELVVTEPVDPTIGDANDDGKVSVADAMTAVKIILDNLANGMDISLFDTNGDGLITISDVSGIIDILLNKSRNSIKILEISPAKSTIQVSETLQLQVHAIPYKSDGLVEWESSNPQIATVSSEGLVTGKTLGSVYIRVRALDDSGVIDSCFVEVNNIRSNGYEYIDLGLPSGLLWATCNVGADKPEDYGGYYAWGETEEKSSYDWSNYFDTKDGGSTFIKYNTNGGKTELDPEDDVAHVKWGGDWRMPTDQEWTELRNNCKWEQVVQNGCSGYLVTGENDSCIFIPKAGTINKSTNSYPNYAYYWSSSINTSNDERAYAVSSHDNMGLDYGCDRKSGLSVRPVIAPKAKSISLPEATTIGINSTYQLNVTILPKCANCILSWKSSNENIVTVSQDGIVTGKAIGQATITATTSDGTNLSASCLVTVDSLRYLKVDYIWNNANVPRIDLGTTFKTNTKMQVKYNYIKMNGTAVIGDEESENDCADLRWFVHDGNKLTFDFPGGYGDGTRIIYSNFSINKIYEHEFGNYYIMDLCDGSILANGSTQTLSRKTNLCLWPDRSYRSSEPSSEQVKIYYIKIYEGEKLVKDFIPVYYEGKYGLWDIVENKFHGTTNDVSVLGYPSYTSSIAFEQKNVMLGIGTVKELKVNFTPEDVANKKLLWKSSDESIATVSQDGIVTGKAIGQATITATTTDGTNLSASCVVTVQKDDIVYYDYLTGIYGSRIGKINTGIYITNNYVIECEFQIDKLPASGEDIGIWGTADEVNCTRVIFGGGGLYRGRFINMYHPSDWVNQWANTNLPTGHYNLRFKDVAYVYNMDTYQTIFSSAGSRTFTSTSQLCLFDYDGGRNTCHEHVKIGHTKVYDGNTLQRDLRPCSYNGEVGMFDSVTNEFYKMTDGVGQLGNWDDAGSDDNTNDDNYDITSYVSASRTGISTTATSSGIYYSVTFEIRNNSSQTIHLESLAGVNINTDLKAGQTYTTTLQSQSANLKDYYQKLIYTYNGKSYTLQV